jgi:hypothetical protein
MQLIGIDDIRNIFLGAIFSSAMFAGVSVLFSLDLIHFVGFGFYFLGCLRYW